MRACAPTDRVANASVNSDVALNTAINQLNAAYAAVGKLSNLQFSRLQIIYIKYLIPRRQVASGSTLNSCGLSHFLISQNTAFSLSVRSSLLPRYADLRQNFQFGQTRKSSLLFCGLLYTGHLSRCWDKTNFRR